MAFSNDDDDYHHEQVVVDAIEILYCQNLANVNANALE